MRKYLDRWLFNNRKGSNLKDLQIAYNLINLPQKVEGEEGTLFLDHSYGGTKVKKVSPDGTTRFYVNGAEIAPNDGGLQVESYDFGDGRVTFKDGKPQFQYKITDHLGNTMVLFQDKDSDGKISTELNVDEPDNAEVLQRNHYYPFGMPMQGEWKDMTAPKMDYLYNGKENDEELGLNWMNFGFRYYDNAVGRFTGVDPIAESFAFVSPFNYAENSPIRYIDLWGLQKTLPDGTTGPFSTDYHEDTWHEHSYNIIKERSNTEYSVHQLEYNPESLMNTARSGDRLSDGSEVLQTSNEAITLNIMMFGLEVVMGLEGGMSGRQPLSKPKKPNMSSITKMKNFDLDDVASFKGAKPDDIKEFLSKKGWEIMPAKKGKPGFRAVNPNNKSDVIHVIQGNSTKLKTDTGLIDVKQGDYLKRPVFGNDRVPLSNNPTL